MNERKVFHGLLAVMLAAAFASLSPGLFAQALPPGRINFQGVLRDASGIPLNGAQTMIFRFYDAASGGTLLWDEVYDPFVYPPQVAVSNGLFTAALGSPAHQSGGSESLFRNVFAGHGTVYLGVTAGTDPEMTPRIQVLSAPYAQNAVTLEGMYPSFFLDTSSAPQTKSEKLTLLGAVDYGIQASGPTAGGHFQDSNNSGYADVGIGDWGIDAHGSIMGGQFHDSNSSGFAYVGYGDDGIDAYGSTWGGRFGDLNGTGYAFVGYGNDGIDAYGNNSGGYFHGPLSGYAYAGASDFGIIAASNYAGSYVLNLISSGFSYMGYSTYKITGTGAVAFIQNHPIEKDKVIIYAAPEGDEVATYTRGTAMLINGEARVILGETFKWVTNPDIGLTTHLTPKGDCNGLYVESVSTTEITVRELNSGKSNTAFDYIVYGLRIGFEESSIVQEKQIESYIPSFKDHRKRYATYPELRAFNALERFKVMESSVRGLAPASIDLSRAKALKDAIHEYDPAIDPPAEILLGYGPGKLEHSAPQGEHALQPVNAPAATTPARFPPEVPVAEPAQDAAAPAAQLEPRPNLPCLPVSETVEAGDVMVIDTAQKGFARRGTMPADPMVVGIAAGPVDDCTSDRPGEGSAAQARVPLSTSGLADCKVDAGYGPVHEGDLLVTSPTPGHAMRAENPAQGTVIGKALEPLNYGTGMMKILVMLR